MLSRKFLFAVFLISIIHYSCKKEIKPSFFNGKVENGLTHELLSGIEIQVIEVSNVRNTLIGPSPVDVIIEKVISNEKGEFTFKLDSVKKDKTYVLKSINTFPLDSTKNTNKFYSESHQFPTLDTKTNILLDLTPSGYVDLFIDNTDWKTIACDTITVECQFPGNLSYSLIRNQINELVFSSLDASKSIEFKFYCINKGSKGKVLTKEFFTTNNLLYPTSTPIRRKLNLDFN